jgi:heme/copper-type cytochrome/quinol oxidase subunit 2
VTFSPVETAMILSVTLLSVALLSVLWERTLEDAAEAETRGEQLEWTVFTVVVAVCAIGVFVILVLALLVQLGVW